MTWRLFCCFYYKNKIKIILCISYVLCNVWMNTFYFIGILKKPNLSWREGANLTWAGKPGLCNNIVYNYTYNYIMILLLYPEKSN